MFRAQAPSACIFTVSVFSFFLPYAVTFTRANRIISASDEDLSDFEVDGRLAEKPGDSHLAAARKRAWTMPMPTASASSRLVAATAPKPALGALGTLGPDWSSAPNAFLRGIRPALTVAQVVALLPAGSRGEEGRGGEKRFFVVVVVFFCVSVSLLLKWVTPVHPNIVAPPSEK